MNDNDPASIPAARSREPWNKGKLIGPKPPLRPSHVWSIRTKLQIEGRTRDLALFNLAIDSSGDIPDDRVHVIEGRRRMPRRPEGTQGPPSSDIRGSDPALLYDILGGDPATWRLVKRLFNGSVPLADFHAPARTHGVDAADLIFAMSRAARKTADNEEERLAPIRLHAFERAVPGIWSCINPECAQKTSDWPFGRILPERADECPSCGAPVLEVVSCFECGEAFLEGIEAGVVPENWIRPDSHGEAESAHHCIRWSRSSACLQRLSPTCSSRGGGLKAKFCFSVINSISR